MTRRRPRRAGFTVMELVIVSGLLALLAVLLSEAWVGFGRPAVDAAATGRLAQEANLAAEALARDFGGGLPGPAGRPGTKAQGRLVGRMQPGNSQLWLCYDGGPAPNGMADWGSPDAVVTYQLQADLLVRSDSSSGASIVVARHLSGLALADLGGRVQVQLTFTYRDLTRTYTLIGIGP
jgi:type II secretory pathway pseudopilin PulG